MREGHGDGLMEPGPLPTRGFGWVAQETYFGAQVLPIDDVLAHGHDETSDSCPCGPRSEDVEGRRLDVHHSLDGRELVEG
jgi:hypothetical protein